MDGFIRGWGVYISVAIFLAGLAFQVVRFFTLTRKKEPVRLPGQPEKKKGKTKTREGGKKSAGKPVPEGMWIQRMLWWFEGRLDPLLRYSDKKLQNLRFSVVAVHPVMTVVTVIFHVFLFVTPLFLLAHNALIGDALGFSLPSFSESATDFMTLLVLFCGGFFVLRRLFVRRVRAISTVYDYFVLLLTLAPFVSGFLAYRHWFDYPTVVTIHILSGEAMLILIPFTKLGHMIFFFFYRFFVGSEYSFGQGQRAW